MTMIRPSGSCAAPSQNTLSGALIVVKVDGLAGFQTSVGSGCCQPSQQMKLALSTKMALSATIGSGSSEPHCRCGCGLGIVWLLGADGWLLPTALVAVTVKVYGVPLVSPEIVVDVAGGLPDTTVAGWATPAVYGVMV